MSAAEVCNKCSGKMLCIDGSMYCSKCADDVMDQVLALIDLKDERERGARGLCAVCLSPADACDGRTCAPYSAPEAPVETRPAAKTPKKRGRAGSVTLLRDGYAEPGEQTWPAIDVHKAEVKSRLEAVFRLVRDHRQRELEALAELEQTLRRLGAR